MVALIMLVDVMRRGAVINFWTWCLLSGVLLWFGDCLQRKRCVRYESRCCRVDEFGFCFLVTSVANGKSCLGLEDYLFVVATIVKSEDTTVVLKGVGL